MQLNAYESQLRPRNSHLCLQPSGPLTVFPPPPSRPQNPHQINKSQQYRNLNQRPHCRRKRLITIRPKRRNSNRNSQLKIITRCGKTLYTRKSVLEVELTTDEEYAEEQDSKVTD